MRFWVLLLTLVFTTSVHAIGVDGDVLEEPKLEAKAQEIMGGIRCLVCQNQSIVDSNAGLAEDLRHIVRERVALGENEAEVQAYLVARYGDWVLLRPPFSAKTWLLWGTPILILGVAGTVILVSRRQRQTMEALSDADTAEADRLIEEYGA